MLYNLYLPLKKLILGKKNKCAIASFPKPLYRLILYMKYINTPRLKKSLKVYT